MQVVVQNQVQVVRLFSPVVFLACTLVLTHMAMCALPMLMILTVLWTPVVTLAAAGSSNYDANNDGSTDCNFD